MYRKLIYYSKHYCPEYFLLKANYQITDISLLLFFSRKEAKESPSDAGLPKFSRKNRAKTKPRSHTGPPLLRVFLRTSAAADHVDFSC
jgi:hypothetical protein